jgi:acetylornithine deacetylase/succinyl-diaminopimelate desuccinylase-like protein
MTTALDAVLADLRGRPEDHLRELAQYVAIPSVSAEGPGARGVRAAAAHITARAQAWGLGVTLIETDGQPAVLLRGPEVSGAPRVLIYGHYDVQPTGDLAAWRFPPFAATVDGGRIYGRGTADNKGQHLAHLLAIESWLRLHGTLPCNVTVLLDGEEEIGSPHLPGLVREQAGLLACDLVLWSDGPVHQSGRATINFGVRGIVQFELTAHGATADLHSGNWGGVAPNPAWDLVRLLASMRDSDGTITIDGITGPVLPVSAAERRALDALPVDAEELSALGITRWDPPAGRPFHDRLAAHPSFTINRLETGTGDANGPARTVIPAVARAVCDLRLVDAMTTAETFSLVAAHVQRHAPQVRCRLLAAMEPSRTDPASPFTEPVRQALRSILHEDPYLVPAIGGSLPDYVFTKILGVPSIGVPFANADEANHAPNENLELDRYLTAPQVAAAMLAGLSAVSRP